MPIRPHQRIGTELRNPGHAMTTAGLALAQIKATEVRRLFEQGSVDYRLLKRLYREYNSVPDLDRFISHAKRLFPHLNCGLACLYLRHHLGYGTLLQGSYRGTSHTFLLLTTHTIADITADQFGGPPVYVGPLCLPWSERLDS